LSSTEVYGSMKKSLAVLTAAALLLALVGIGLLIVANGPVVALAVALIAMSTLLGFTASGGRIAMRRQRRIDEGQVDLLQQLNAPRDETAVASGAVPAAGSLRRWIARTLLRREFLVGDSVRIKPYEQIRSTLDADGKLEGLPFMEEMKAFCGRAARVYRVLDRVYDYGRSREMRQIERCVLLGGLRCDGGGHDGCDAACYLVWKEAWLDPMASDERLTHIEALPPRQSDGVPIEAGKRFSCQYTELTAASQPRVARGLRRWFEPWIIGNVTAAGWWAVAATRAFNAFQQWRGGATYPTRPVSGGQTARPGESLQRGGWVRVRSPGEIAETLDSRGNHRGLWFDRDMLKHCGQTYRVLGHVKRIVDIRSTAMIAMKTPCVVLEGVHYSGEFQWFGEQHDYLYWREVWLQPVAPPTAQG